MRLVLIILALAIASLCSTGVAAQTPGELSSPIQGNKIIYAPSFLGSVAETPSRLASTRREMNRNRVNPSNLVRLPGDPATVLANAQAAMNRSGKTCEVVEAVTVGRAINGRFVYEADCAVGEGYLVVADFPADAVTCAALGDGIGDRERDRDTDVIDECKLPGNAMTPDLIAAYARQAGVSCAVGDAVQIGRNVGGAVFEVSCGGGEAFWVQSDGARWSRVSCLKVTGQGGACRFSTPTDQAMLLTTHLSNAPTPCQVSRTAYVGSNGADDYFEAVCASGSGLMLKLDADARVQQSWPCERAASIGGGCTLTTTVAARN